MAQKNARAGFLSHEKTVPFKKKRTVVISRYDYTARVTLPERMQRVQA